MKRIFITIVFFIAILGIAKSAYRFGWARTTSSDVITQDEWACLIEKYGGFQPTLQVYGPNGKINQNAITSLNNWCTVTRSGLVTAIYSPCFSNCNHRVTPADQIDYLFTTMANNNITDGLTVLVAIDPYWPKNKKSNQKFLLDTLDAIRTNPTILTIGIMANATTWTKVFGPNFTTPSQNPYNFLWWVYYDDAAWVRNGRNNGNTNPWKSFGGWSKPLMHEYVAGQTNPECTNKTFAYST